MDIYQREKKVLGIVLLANWVVAFLKIFFGMLTGVLSLSADGFHSLSDGSSNVLGLIMIKIAQKPADSKYPYGYGKYKAIAAFCIAGLLFYVALELTVSIFQRIISPLQPEINFLIFGVLAITLLIDYMAAKYEYSEGKKLKSIVLKADSKHTRSHIFITLGVILGIMVMKLGYPVFDPIIATIIVGLIIKFGWEIFKEASGVLCDRAPIDPKKIEEVLKCLESVSVHQIRSRGDPSCVYSDVHLGVDPDLSVGEAHEMFCRKVREIIQEKIPEVKDVVTHIEPADKDKECACK